MGLTIDRQEIERIAFSVHTSEILANIIIPEAAIRNRDGSIYKYDNFPPMERPVQERYEWWKEHGVVRAKDETYPYLFAIGKVVCPYLIAEIGLWWSYSLMAFGKGARAGWKARGNEQAAREVTLNGFDNEQYSPGCVEWGREKLMQAGFCTNLMVADTQKMEKLPLHMIDLFSVDGDHTYNSALHDLQMAHETMVPPPRGCIVVDDVGWALCVRDATMDFCKEYGWKVEHYIPTLKGLFILTRED